MDLTAAIRYWIGTMKDCGIGVEMMRSMATKSTNNGYRRQQHSSDYLSDHDLVLTSIIHPLVITFPTQVFKVKSYTSFFMAVQNSLLSRPPELSVSMT